MKIESREERREKRRDQTCKNNNTYFMKCRLSDNNERKLQMGNDTNKMTINYDISGEYIQIFIYFIPQKCVI